MSNIDDLKDKLNDGEYLYLCNLLKSLNDEIKDLSKENEEREQRHSGDPYAEIGLNQDILFDEDKSLTERIFYFFHSPYFYAREGEEAPRYSFNEVLEFFKNFLLEIHEQEEENENFNGWFTCACGCSVAFRDIPEHLETANHQENFRIEI